MIQDNLNPTELLLELDGHRYPPEYRWLRFHGFRDMTPWHCIDDLDQATTVRKEFLVEVGGGSIPVHDFLPFAHSKPGDDYAGFIQSRGNVTGDICVAHLTFRGAAEVSNYPRHVIYPSLWDWLTMVFAQTRQACEPGALADLEASFRKRHARRK